MTAVERVEPRTGRVSIAVDRMTRIACPGQGSGVRLLAWTAVFATCCLLLWMLAGQVAHADPDPVSGADDPRQAAREIGQAGSAAAAAIVGDASKPAAVPGYAGTDVPERGLTDAAMAGEAQRRLADPDDPGAKAGRAVIEGTAVRPAAPIPADDPGVARARAVEASPEDPAYRAGGLASGNTADCAAGVADAGRGGACGSVSYCVGAGCESVEPQGNTGFARSAAMLNMVLEMGGEEFDRDELRFFTGERRACRIRWGGLANCCRNSGLLVGLANCSASEIELAEERNAGNTHYLGTRCAKRVFGVCIRRERVWCVFGSKLGRILQQQGRAQLGVGWSSCRGLTVAEVEGIDFASLDLSEFTEDLMDGSREPAVSLPDADGTGEAMRTRIREFYRRGQ